jgi:hypothetical protein
VFADFHRRLTIPKSTPSIQSSKLPFSHLTLEVERKVLFHDETRNVAKRRSLW